MTPLESAVAWGSARLTKNWAATTPANMTSDPTVERLATRTQYVTYAPAFAARIALT
jgi:hypothetical protein